MDWWKYISLPIQRRLNQFGKKTSDFGLTFVTNKEHFKWLEFKTDVCLMIFRLLSPTVNGVASDDGECVSRHLLQSAVIRSDGLP